MKSIILLLAATLVGCASPQQLFISHRNAEVGRTFFQSWSKEILSKKLNPRGGEILVIQEGTCQYRVFLNNDRVVTAWEYVSDPEDCCVRINWRAPW